MNSRYILLMSILVFFSFGINAEENVNPEENEQKLSGWYIGVLAGHGSVDIQSSSHTNNQDDITSVGLYGGYNISDQFALEGNIFFTGELADSQANLVSAHLAVLTFTPKLTYNVNDMFSFFGKVGMAVMIYEEEYDNYILYERNYDQQWGGEGAVLGLGMQLSFSNGFVIALNYDRVMGEVELMEETYYSNASDIDIDLEQVSLGVHYRF